MITGLLSALLVALRPGASGAEVLLVAGVLAAALAVVVVLRVTEADASVAPAQVVGGFAAIRVRLRSSDPDAEGHRRARAPGATR